MSLEMFGTRKCFEVVGRSARLVFVLVMDVESLGDFSIMDVVDRSLQKSAAARHEAPPVEISPLASPGNPIGRVSHTFIVSPYSKKSMRTHPFPWIHKGWLAVPMSVL
jgi:hypothetical protein